MKAVLGAVGALLALLVAAPIVVLVGVSGGTATSDAAICATDINLAPILTTIRDLESGGDYTITAAASTASGAYQFLDSTWADYGGYPRAADAPSAVQDQKAAELVRAVLAAHNGDVSTVPVSWYIGHVPEPTAPEWDTVPPYPGNVLTPREYQTRWMEQYATQQATTDAGSCMVPVGSFTPGGLPDHLNCGEFTWGGYSNGQIPLSAMRFRPYSGSLHPAASEAYDQLYAAAQAAGFDLRVGEGYRPRAAGGATAGTSCHGLGLAVDIASLVTDDPRATEVFASPAWQWLCANAERYGWITPRWAIPAGQRCGSVVGTGAGGHRGDRCCFLEPWHLEAAGVVATHADFIGLRDLAIG